MDEFFGQNRDFLLSKGRKDVVEAIALIDPMTHPNLYLRMLHTALTAYQRPKTIEEFNAVIGATRRVLDNMDFLNKHGRNYLNRMQVIARHLTSMLLYT